MSIYYKAKTEKAFNKIDIPESFINVLELKKRLIEKDKIDMKRDFRFTLTDESGANEYLDDASVMKNASVLYKIEPLREGEIGILRKISQMGKKPTRREIAAAAAQTVAPPPSVGLRPVPKPSFVAVAPTQGSVVHEKDAIPPPGYVCNRCFVRGHFEENCPTLMDPDWPSKMRRWNINISRGIPLERLAIIEDPFSVETLLRLGQTIVRHPLSKYLCTVEKPKTSQLRETARVKVSIGVFWELSCIELSYFLFG